jgi:broad specificity phosphatase PhoE
MLLTYFVHGTTTDNELDLATGWAPGMLSDVGRKQAEELGRQVGGVQFDVVFCSDLKRAIESAELAFGGKFKIVQDHRLREADYGDFTEKPAGDFKNNLPRYISAPFPNGESYEDVEARIADFVDFVKSNYAGKSIAIVAHQAPQLAFEVITKNITWEQAIREDWRHTKSWRPGWKYDI